jgi:D-sedoheptulose 7-phosphate isomerase
MATVSERATGVTGEAPSPIAARVAARVKDRLLQRNQIIEEFFAREAFRLAEACRAMSERFTQGGRLLAFGKGPYATDAQHVSVEFVHPVIVGKRALPALDISMLFRPWLESILRPEDIVMGFGPPDGDNEIRSALQFAQSRNALTFALPDASPDSADDSYAVEAFTKDPFIHQEMIEILYHVLWESVHVFLEHREMGHDVGASGFLYPFLGQAKQDTGDLVAQVAASIQMKVKDDSRLRVQVADEQAEQISNAAIAIHERVSSGGKLVLFGNGGSATDANDWMIDCVMPPDGYHPVPAVSLSMEPANISAIANDVGTDVVFLRQLIAQARPEDVAIGISTSGGSRNIIMALEEARKRKMLTVALLGYDGGEIKRRGIADFPIVVQCDYIPRIQEIQASIYHIIREMLEVLSRGQA